MKKLIAGNWKMNGTVESAIELTEAIEAKIEQDESVLERCDFVVCPPFLHLVPVQGSLDKVTLGAQDCSAHESGAYTGDVSAAMLADLGAQYVILGHSERRQNHGESDAVIRSKVEIALKNNLIPIVCVGETEAQRDADEQYNVVGTQIGDCFPALTGEEDIVIAYEPVWAIGTGKSATVDDIKTMHTHIATCFKQDHEYDQKIPRILYGGSVKPGNAGEIFAVDNVDGALIGGASLKAEDFLGIAKAV